MANTKNKKKQKQQKKSPAAADSRTENKKAISKKDEAKASNKKDSKAASKAKKNAKPGLVARGKKYLSSVRSEMRRVTWPSKKELINYSITVCVSLVVVGIVIAVLDFAVGEGLMLFSSLRG